MHLRRLKSLASERAHLHVVDDPVSSLALGQRLGHQPLLKVGTVRS